MLTTPSGNGPHWCSHPGRAAASARRRPGGSPRRARLSALVARRRDRLKEPAGAIRADGGPQGCLEADMTDRRRATGRGGGRRGLGRLDTLVNNAGVMLVAPARGRQPTSGTG